MLLHPRYASQFLAPLPLPTHKCLPVAGIILSSIDNPHDFDYPTVFLTR